MKDENQSLYHRHTQQSVVKLHVLNEYFPSNSLEQKREAPVVRGESSVITMTTQIKSLPNFSIIGINQMYTGQMFIT